jgi:hypothetical protein
MPPPIEDYSALMEHILSRDSATRLRLAEDPASSASRRTIGWHPRDHHRIQSIRQLKVIS